MSGNAEQYKCAVIIPALNPEPELTAYVRELLARGIPAVVVVDDGSRADTRPIFDEIASVPNAYVCRHTVNRGKGCALKTAYQFVLDEPALAGMQGVVTADADGQHDADDVLRVAEMTQASAGRIVLGTRNLRLSNVPPRSKLGNRLTSFAFYLLYGAKLEDTQTGLRGFPRDLLEWCIGINGDRFEYEMNVLIRAVRDRVPFCETRIQTIYYNNNAGSHLHAGRDTWRVFLILMSGLGMYTVAAAVSAVIDVGMFWVSYRFLFAGLGTAACYLASTVLARVLSSAVNFTLNRRYVFKSECGKFNSAVRYYSLWLTQMMASYLGLLGLQALLPVPAVILKACVDIILAVASYQIQMRWVFRGEKAESKKES